MCAKSLARHLADSINYVLLDLPMISGCEFYDFSTGHRKEFQHGEDIYLTTTDYITRIWWNVKSAEGDHQSSLEFKIDYDLGIIEIQSGSTEPIGYTSPFSRIALGGAVTSKALVQYEIFVVPSSRELLSWLKCIVEAFHFWPCISL